MLFTSYRALRAVAEGMRRQGVERNWPLFVQGEAPRAQLVRSFTDSGRGLLLGTCLCMATQANAVQPAGLLATNALQAVASSNTARYELGAVVDVRQANRNGIAILAVTPGGAADRMGL